MNVALILAGGSGKRTEQDIPKQFMNVYEQPIMIYTLLAFQQHPDIDAILVVCLSGWHEILWAYAREYNITKLKWVVNGGDNGQDSTERGVNALTDICESNDIIIIHDGIRPMVSSDIITDCIETCRLYGSGLSAVRCQETIVRTEDGIVGKDGIARTEIMRVQTPQAYKYENIIDAFNRARERDITDTVYLNMLMLELGENVYFSKGSEKNIKITTMEDVEIFKALTRVKKEDWVK